MADAGRVIGGSAGGLRLAAPGEGTRPFADRVKQALFGSLEADPDEPLAGPFLDLFAGSGAAGVEALSRGAPSAVFVERDQGAARVVADNLARTHLDGGRVVKADVLRFLDGDPLAAGGRRTGDPRRDTAPLPAGTHAAPAVCGGHAGLPGRYPGPARPGRRQP